MLECSLGILAYNEEKNIGRLLKAVQEQRLQEVRIKEIIVVSSGSTDRTDEIVAQFAKMDPNIRLLTQQERKGKSSAINLFLQHSSAPILIIESGDTIPEKDTIEKLILPFQDSTIGMTGGRPQPINNQKTPVGFAVCLLWKLHDKMAKISPKLGEMVAFRNIVKSIPEKSAVDEASIEAIIKKNGLKLHYVRDAIVYNKGPDNISDFLKQRRRIYAGHLWLQDNQKYKVVSQNGKLIAQLTAKELSFNIIKDIKIFITVLLEIIGRSLGWYDYKIRKLNPYKWDIATSTKALSKKI